MSFKIFLSHSHYDKGIAEVIAKTLSRITLGQLDVWFSSDPGSSGGMQPGVWLDQVRTRLAQSRAVIPLLTPRSVIQPWLLFETGFGASQKECEVIPIAVGINPMDIPFPIAMYQVFSVTNYESFRNVIARILLLYNIKFDEEMVSSVLKTAISEIIQEFQPNENNYSSPERSINEYFEEIKEHFDRRFLEYERRQIQTLNIDTQTNYQTQLASYSVPIRLRFSSLENTQYIEINEYVSIQDVLDNVYRMLSSHVEAFQYLQTWILRDVKVNRNLIIREVGDCIPARYVFKQNSEWEAIPLKSPYSGKESKDYQRWYHLDRI